MTGCRCYQIGTIRCLHNKCTHNHKDTLLLWGKSRDRAKYLFADSIGIESGKACCNPCHLSAGRDYRTVVQAKVMRCIVYKPHTCIRKSGIMRRKNKSPSWGIKKRGSYPSRTTASGLLPYLTLLCICPYLRNSGEQKKGSGEHSPRVYIIVINPVTYSGSSGLSRGIKSKSELRYKLCLSFTIFII